jgi:hypothetical protein
MESMVQTVATCELLVALGEEFGRNDSAALKGLIQAKALVLLEKCVALRFCFVVGIGRLPFLPLLSASINFFDAHPPLPTLAVMHRLPTPYSITRPSHLKTPLPFPPHQSAKHNAGRTRSASAA